MVLLMKNKFFLLFCFSLLLFSCKTSDKDEQTKIIDYTDEQVVLDTIKEIRTLSESKPIRAFYRAELLKLNVQENAEVVALFEECKSLLVENFKQSEKDGDFLSALRIFDSYNAITKSSEIDFATKRENLVSEIKMPLESSNKNSDLSLNSENFADFVSGTVTVLVDLGIKVQNGVGRQETMLGSGFFISKNGYIVTNHHVIASCVDPSYEGFARLYIKLSNDSENRIPARVVGYDSTIDLALLKTEVDAPYVFSLGSSSELAVGDTVYAIGSPVGLERTLTRGIVSTTDRGDLMSLGKVFQIDAAVNSGNSGGPLIDSSGRVQAVVYAGVLNYQGLNFAIPVEYLKNELYMLYSGGERKHPWIGIYGKTNKNYNKANGLVVHYVMPGSAAFLSGIKSGDVLVSVNGTQIYTAEDFHLLFMQFQTDSIINVGILDENENVKEVPLYLDNRPSNPGYEMYRRDLLENALLPIFGMELLHASTLSKNDYVISKIIKGSAADESGFSEGDPVKIINVEVNKEKTALFMTLFAKKRKNSFLDVGLSIACPLDSEYYF